MEIVKHKNEDQFINLLLSSFKPSSNSLSRITESNKQSLKELISYLSKIKKDEVIDEKQYTELVILACANFIENEVEVRISKSLNDRIMFFFEKL